MTTTIYGASDDLIEVDGDLYEEFSYQDDGAGDLLGFSDGTLLRIRHDEEGVWRITPIRIGTKLEGVEQAPADDDKNYSDRATFSDNLAWVLHGGSYAKAGAR